MKIKVDQASLLSALEACATVADAKSAHVWGSCVIVETSDATRTVTCRADTGLQAVARTLRSDVATIVKAGIVMVNAKDAAQRVAALDAGEVTIEELPGSVKISQGGTRYSLPKLDAAQAPAQGIVEPQGAEIDAKAFAALLARVAPMMGTNEAQVSTWGVSVATEGGKMVARAINGKVGAIAPMTFDGEIAAMIPAPAVKHLQTLLAKIGGGVRLAAVGSSLHVFADDLAFSTLLAGDPPPKFDTMVPARKGESVQLDRAAAVKAIKAVTIGDAKDGRLRLRSGPDGITFRGQSKDTSDCARLVSCVSGIKSLSCAATYLLNVLEFSNESTVTLWIAPGKRVEGGGGEPITIEEDGAICLAMPLYYDAIDLAPDSPEWT